MNVCVVTQQLGKVVSGPGLTASQLVPRLVDDGHLVTVVAPSSQRPPDDARISFAPAAEPLIHNHARWFPFSLSVNRVLQQLEKNKSFDLIHFTEVRDAYFCSSRSALVGNVVDTYTAEVFSSIYYRRYYRDWLTRWLYYRATHWIEKWRISRLSALLATSQFTADTIARQYAEVKSRVHTCYPAINPAAYASALGKRCIAVSHPPRVLCVGGNMQRKGVPILIRAAVQICAELPDCQFWIVGRDPAIPALIELCRKLGVEKNFQFTGWKPQAELPNIYAQADVFAMPSLVETFGFVYLEAMASGVPVVGTRTGGVPEIIQDGVNGCLVPVDDPDALARAILKILSNPAAAAQMQHAGLDTVQHFTVDKMMNGFYSAYQTVLAR